MYRALCLCLLLTACGEAHRSVATPMPPVQVAAPTDAPADRMDAIAAHIAELPADKRDEAAASLRFLSANCAYTRMALQVPFALYQGVIDISWEHDEEPAEWQPLLLGLTQHIDTLDALDVDLALPSEDDFLYQRLGILTDRATLMVQPTHVEVTHAFIQEVPVLASQTGEDLRAQIEEHSERVEQATGVIRQCPRGPWSVQPGHPWTLGRQLGDWHDTLKQVQTTATDPVIQEQLAALVSLLDAYNTATFEHVGTH